MPSDAGRGIENSGKRGVRQAVSFEPPSENFLRVSESEMNVTNVTGKVVNGGLELDQALDIENERRVRVTIQEIEDSAETTPDEALEALLQLIREKPIHGGGIKFTREELYERD